MNYPNEIPILFATVTGNACDLAYRAAKMLQNDGLPVSAQDMAKEQPERLMETPLAFFVVSTWGKGEPPDDALDYFAGLQRGGLDLQHLSYSVCGLGDRTYDLFCGFGKNLDQTLGHLGGQRIVDRVDCDVDFHQPFEDWFRQIRNVVERPLTILTD